MSEYSQQKRARRGIEPVKSRFRQSHGEPQRPYHAVRGTFGGLADSVSRIDAMIIAPSYGTLEWGVKRIAPALRATRRMPGWIPTFVWNADDPLEAVARAPPRIVIRQIVPEEAIQ